MGYNKGKFTFLIFKIMLRFNYSPRRQNIGMVYVDNDKIFAEIVMSSVLCMSYVAIIFALINEIHPNILSF